MGFDEIKIIGVDREHIEKDPALLNALKYPYILSVKPDDHWVKFLHHAHRMSSLGNKRQYSIVGNQIVTIVFPGDNMQAQLDFFKELVTSANQEYRSFFERKEEEKREEEEKKKRERDAISKLKEEVDKLRF